MRTDARGAYESEERRLAPFLLRFGQPQESNMEQERRYDARRQESVVRVDGQWRAALDAGRDLCPGTLTTEVKKETTDNE